MYKRNHVIINEPCVIDVGTRSTTPLNELSVIEVSRWEGMRCRCFITKDNVKEELNGISVYTGDKYLVGHHLVMITKITPKLPNGGLVTKDTEISFNE